MDGIAVEGVILGKAEEVVVVGMVEEGEDEGIRRA